MAKESESNQYAWVPVSERMVENVVTYFEVYIFINNKKKANKNSRIFFPY